MKGKFCAGMCTTSRIESKHRVFKKYLNSSNRLVEIFKVFRELEKLEVQNFKNEIERLLKRERQKMDCCDLIKHFEKIYSKYAVLRLKDNLLEAINYKSEKTNKNTW